MTLVFEHPMVLQEIPHCHLPYTLWPVALEHLKCEDLAQVPMWNTKVGLKVVCFGCSWVFLISNFQILSVSKLLAFYVCCHLHNSLLRKSPYPSNRP